MRFLAALLALAPLHAVATSATTDFSDLWFNPNEEGWGVNIIQQNNIQFITLFVYGPDNKPKWYVGPATVLFGTINGRLTFSGPLYETTGPFLGAPVFDENQVNVVRAGDIAFGADQVGSATLSYTVNNQPITKTIQRQTWSYEAMSGAFSGAVVSATAGCGAQRDGYSEQFSNITINHSGNSITLKDERNGETCEYSGTYIQKGRFGEITATGSCTSGAVQSFAASEVIGGIQGLTMRYLVTWSGNCRTAGRMGGVRKGLAGL
jgi:hypothetical protein